MSEPATTLTDYLMAALAVVFARHLARAAGVVEHARAWSWAFALLAASALCGGTFHGFRAALAPWAAQALWRLTLALAAGSSFALMRALALQWLGTARRAAWIRVALGKLAIVLAIGLSYPAFSVVVADFGATMLFAAGAGAVGRGRHPRAFLWLTAGVLLFGVGALIQQARLAPHPAFNHNDLFHVIQLLGNTSLFASARSGRSSRSA